MEKSGREYLSKLFFELAKFSFVGLVVAGLFAMFTGKELTLAPMLMILLGITMTVLFGFAGYKLSK
jgi:hypothetical protein